METIKRIQLADEAAFNLLLLVNNYIGLTDELRERAEADEQAGKPIWPIVDNYQVLYDWLEGTKNDAKRLLKNLQKQTGIVFYDDKELAAI